MTMEMIWLNLNAEIMASRVPQSRIDEAEKKANEWLESLEA